MFDVGGGGRAGWLPWVCSWNAVGLGRWVLLVRLQEEGILAFLVCGEGRWPRWALPRHHQPKTACGKPRIAIPLRNPAEALSTRPHRAPWSKSHPDPIRARRQTRGPKASPVPSQVPMSRPRGGQNWRRLSTVDHHHARTVLAAARRWSDRVCLPVESGSLSDSVQTMNKISDVPRFLG